MPNEFPPPRPEPRLAFDLTSRPWLPVRRLDGSEAELSLRQIFAQAARLRRLVGDVPTQEFALLRLLLAILHDAIDGPADADDWLALWEKRQQHGLPADAVGAYLDEHRERFDLLHPVAPFFQVAGLRTASGEVPSLDRIVADVPNGERFFTMRARGADRLGFAEAARWVVHAQAFDPSGIKSGAVGDPRVKGGRGYPQGVAWAGNLGGVFAEGAEPGASLADTLLLNLIAADTGSLRAGPGDRPAWCRPPCAPGPDPEHLSPDGIRDLYTWQSRRLRLHYDAEGVRGVLLAYGDPLAARNKHRREPMTAWRRSPAQEKKHGMPLVYLPREPDPARSAWRGLASLVASRPPGGGRGAAAGGGGGGGGEPARELRPLIVEWIARLTTEDCLPADYLIRARVVGAVYGTQQSVIDDVVDDQVTMALVLLHERDRALGQTAVDAVGDADEAVKVLGFLAADLAQAADADPAVPRDTARDRGYGALDGPFRRWLAGLRPGDAPGRRRAEWQRQARRIVLRLGTELVRGAGEAAWQGLVIETKHGSVWLDAPRADLRFRTALRKALPLASTAAENNGEERR